MDILTDEKAHLINNFWTSAEDRLDTCDGDIRETVIRLFGQSAICHFLYIGGVCSSTGWVLDRISKDLRGEEGWGGEGDVSGTFGWCGIRVVAADVELPSFNWLGLSEVATQ
ncbi:hypothetical protein D3C78_1336310 [compost metagenome]